MSGSRNGTVKLGLPEGWKAPEQQFSTAKDGDDQSLSFHVIPARLKRSLLNYRRSEYNGQEYKEDITA